MTKEQRQDERKRTLPVIIAVLILIGTAMWVSVLLPDNVDPKSQPSQPPAQQQLREWEGKIALFEGDATQPIEVYEVAIASLPSEEQQRLRDGIIIENEDMLVTLLENYTS